MDISMAHGVRTNATHFGTSLKKFFVLLAAMMLAVLALTFAAPASSASAAEAIAQCNGIDNSGGLGINCEVTVTNNLDITTGVASSTVTVKDCGGSARVVTDCTTSTTSYDSLTTSVNQCNGATNGGGAVATCSVSVVNNITGGSTSDITAATVNQCNTTGEGGGAVLICDPFPASTTDATITQCNNSTNGGGGTVTCTATPSTRSAQLPVSINQCNDSTNGGGAVLTCSALLTNNVLTATAPTTPTTPTAKNVLNDARTDGFTHPGWNDGSSNFMGVGVLLVAWLLTAVFVTRRLRAHR